jgi:hypothetical protein
VPVSALTAIANTQLLTLQNNRFVDTSSNAATITRNGDTKIQALSPFRASGAYNPVTHGGSAYFDGSGDYLSIPDNAALQFAATTPFTIEAWVYPGEAIQKGLVVKRGASATQEWGILTGSGGTAMFGGSSTNLVGSALQLYTWNHIAATSDGTTVSLYLNGLFQGSASASSLGVTSSTNAVLIGSQTTSSNPFTGYISGVRVVKGQVLFTGNFTVPTAPPGITQTSSANVAAMSGNVTLLTNFTNAGIVDYTTRNDVYTTTRARVSNVQSKFGTGSFVFVGSIDTYWFIGPGNNSSYPPLLPTLGDFTVEFWAYATTADTTVMCLNTNLSAFAAVRITLNANGSLGILASTDGSSHTINTASSA